ncbi:MAG: hypothetical protein ACFBZ8_01665 [Opitutales bacterium]
MYPILASGLMAAGHRLLEGVIAPTAQRALNAVGEAFSGESIQAPTQAKAVSPLSQRLSAQGVTDAQGLANHRFHLQQQLLQHPEVRSFLDQFDPGAGISLSLEQGSLFTLKGPDGRSLSFPADSELGQLAMELHQVASVDEALKQQPGLSLFDVADQVSEAPGLQANWVLRSSIA